MTQPNFEDETARHRDSEADCAVIYSYDELKEKEKAKECSEGIVSGKRGVVGILSLDDRAG
jgi:hypothetical protein